MLDIAKLSQCCNVDHRLFNLICRLRNAHQARLNPYQKDNREEIHKYVDLLIEHLGESLAYHTLVAIGYSVHEAEFFVFGYYTVHNAKFYVLWSWGDWVCRGWERGIVIIVFTVKQNAIFIAKFFVCCCLIWRKANNKINYLSLISL